MAGKRRRRSKGAGRIVVMDLATASTVAATVERLERIVNEMEKEWSDLLREQAQCLQMLAQLGKLHAAGVELTEQLSQEAAKRSDAAKRASRKRHKPILPESRLGPEDLAGLANDNEWEETEQVALTEILPDDSSTESIRDDMDSRQKSANAAGK